MCIFIKNCTFPPLVDAQRARSAFRAYGGRAASFAPTAGTQCLPRLRRSLRKQTARSLLSAPQGKSYGSNQPIVTAQCLTGVLPGRVV